jgi:hypothetical protein
MDASITGLMHTCIYDTRLGEQRVSLENDPIQRFGGGCKSIETRHDRWRNVIKMDRNTGDKNQPTTRSDGLNDTGPSNG